MYKYEYDLKDHLGNTRTTVTWDAADATQLTPKILQQNDYYAFGLSIKSLEPNVPSPKNQYLYNGKELQDETGLYDYGARPYDPVIARWTSVDPKAELGRRWSPYNYAFNDPMRFVDPEGMWPDWGEVGMYLGGGAKSVGDTYRATMKALRDPIGTARDFHKGIKNGAVKRALVRTIVKPVVKASTGDHLDRAEVAGHFTGEVAPFLIPGGDIAKAGDMAKMGEAAKAIEEGAGAARAAKFSSQWSSASLDAAIQKFAPGAEGVVNGQKTLYTNSETGIQVVFDNSGDYFRIQYTNLSGKRQYLDMDGKVPNNKVVDGKQKGRSKGEYEQVTHFSNTDNK